MAWKAEWQQSVFSRLTGILVRMAQLRGVGVFLIDLIWIFHPKEEPIRSSNCANKWKLLVSLAYIYCYGMARKAI
jgi:hypothetical protein